MRLCKYPLTYYYNLFKQHGKPITLQAMSGITGINYTTLLRNVKRMYALGWLDSTATGTMYPKTYFVRLHG